MCHLFHRHIGIYYTAYRTQRKLRSLTNKWLCLLLCTHCHFRPRIHHRWVASGKACTSFCRIFGIHFFWLKNILLCFLCTRISCKFLSLRSANKGWCSNAFFKRSELIKIFWCFLNIPRISGSARECVTTKGTRLFFLCVFCRYSNKSSLFCWSTLPSCSSISSFLYYYIIISYYHLFLFICLLILSHCPCPYLYFYVIIYLLFFCVLCVYFFRSLIVIYKHSINARWCVNDVPAIRSCCVIEALSRKCTVV